MAADSTAFRSTNCSPPNGIRKMPYSASGPAPIRSTSGWITFSVKAVTKPVNAAPMTTATARSITFPREMNSLKPFSMARAFLVRVTSRPCECQAGMP